jgi:hypothetical protein
MGILADIFVASSEDAFAYEDLLNDGEPIEPPRFQRLEFKHLTGLEFGFLWAILEGVPWDVKRHMLVAVDRGGDYESWLEEFPEPLVSALANVDDAAIPGVCIVWGAKEELRQLAAPDLEQVVRDLKTLAQSCAVSGKSMYLWGCL